MFIVDSRLGPLICTCLLTLYGIYRWRQRRAKSCRLPLPPGPKGLPLIGNLYDVPTAFQWEQYAKWGEEYNSDILYLNVAGTSIVVVNSHKAATDLFEKRSSIYSSRPESPMLKDLVKLDWVLSMMAYGESWRKRRQLFQTHFHLLDKEGHQPKELECTRKLLKHLHHSPEAFLEHIRHAIGTMAITTAYGIDTKPHNDPYVEIARKAMVDISLAAAPGAFLVNAIPALKYIPSWFPGAGFKRKAQEWSRSTRALLETPFYASEKAIAEGTANPDSFVPTCLSNLNETQGTQAQRSVIMDTAANFFIGGADTSVHAVTTFILQMTLNPEIQAKAQAELDRVVGKYILPTFSDEPSLPYIGAIVKEVLRWHTIAPLAVPRFIQAEDEYNGYLIPKNSLVIGNAWAILHDRRDYRDPLAFRPERFLTPDGSQLDPTVREPNAAFGFGRRICPGRQMATSTLYIAIVSILSVFKISNVRDEDGNPVIPSGKYYSSGLLLQPIPFQCAITPRSAEAENVIMAL